MSGVRKKNYRTYDQVAVLYAEMQPEELQKAGARCESQEERKGDSRKAANSYCQSWCEGISVRHYNAHC